MQDFTSGGNVYYSNVWENKILADEDSVFLVLNEARYRGKTKSVSMVRRLVYISRTIRRKPSKNLST